MRYWIINATNVLLGKLMPNTWNKWFDDVASNADYIYKDEAHDYVADNYDPGP